MTAVGATTDIYWEIRTAGSSDNGGGYVRGSSGTDYSQQDAAQISYTDLVIDAVSDTIVTSAANPFTSAHVGNVINITGGTGFTTGRYVVESVDGSNNATLGAACGTTGSTGGTGKLGGAITINPDTGDTFWEDLYNGHICWVKADGTHTLTATIDIAQDGNAANYINFFGYNTTRGDGVGSTANRATIACGVYNFAIDNYYYVKNVDFTGTGTYCLAVGTYTKIQNSSFTNTSGTNGRYGCQGLSNTGGAFFGCEFSCTNGIGLSVGGGGVSVSFCYSYGGQCGFQDGDAAAVTNCIFECGTNTSLGGWSPAAVNAGNQGASFVNCTMYGQGSGKGIYINSGIESYTFQNLIIDNFATGIQYDSNNRPDTDQFLNINITNCTTAVGYTYTAPTINNQTALDPEFGDAANGDFSVGANMDSLGYPATIDATTTNLQLGAVGYAYSAGGGASFSASVT